MMKNALTYGFGITVASSLLTLVLFFLGYHNDVEKMASGTAKILGALNWIIMIVGITLAIRTRRDASEDESLSYGQGVGAGTLTGVFTGLFSGVFTILYATVINPAFIGALQEQQKAVLAERGMSQAQIDQTAGMMEAIMSLPVIATMAIMFSVIFGFFVALIASAFLKRTAPEPALEPPPLQS